MEKEDLFLEIYNKSQKLMYGIIRRIFSCKEDIEDVYQEAMIKIYKNLHNVQKQESLIHWVITITKNTALTILRKYKNRIDVLTETGEFDDYCVQDSSFDNLEAKDLIDKTEVKIRNKTHKEMFFKFHIDGYSLKELSDEYNKPMGTIKSSLFRVEKHFSDLIQELEVKQI